MLAACDMIHQRLKLIQNVMNSNIIPISDSVTLWVGNRPYACFGLKDYEYGFY